VQADKEEARSQLAAATADVESTSQQLAAASSARTHAEQALQEMQQLHDKLVAEQAELQAKVSTHHSLTAAGCMQCAV
jgi:chromosome segregation ATPase